jgi:hypothetical protein
VAGTDSAYQKGEHHEHEYIFGKLEKEFYWNLLQLCFPKAE